MWIDTRTATTWALIWFVFPLLLFLSLRANSGSGFVVRMVDKLNRYGTIGVLALALFVRFVPAVLLPVGAEYDIVSFKLVGEALLANEEVYTSSAMGRHPYLPMQMYLIGGMTYIAQNTNIPFVILIKSLPILADLLITAVILHVGVRLKLPLKETLFLGLMYALNPISILVSAYHGQFDPVPVLLLLLAWFAYEINQQSGKTAVWLGLASLNKTWPIVFFPIVFIRLPDHKKRLTFTLVTLTIPIVMSLGYIIFFDADPMLILNTIFGYSGNVGHWGWSALLASTGLFSDTVQKFYETMLDAQKIVIILVGLVVLWATRRQSTLNALTTIILCIFTITAGFGIQWLLWVVPFGILARDWRFSKWYAAMGAIYIIAQLYGWHMYPWARIWFPSREIGDMVVWLASVPAWFTTFVWAMSRVRRIPKLSFWPRTSPQPINK